MNTHLALIAAMSMSVITNAIAGPLPEWDGKSENADWLLGRTRTKAGVFKGESSSEIVLANGLVSRTFRISPNAATVGFDNLVTGEALLRAVKPEASLNIDGKQWNVGGLKGQPNLAFLRRDWLEHLTSDPNAFQFDGYEHGLAAERIPWKRWKLSPKTPWPPKGVSLTLWFKAPSTELQGIRVGVHYELYDGLPLISKWLTVENKSSKSIRIENFSCEILGMVEGESNVDASPTWVLPNLTVVTNYSFGGMGVNNSNRTVNWETDPEYGTQVNYDKKTPCVLEVKPPIGPSTDLEPGKNFESFHVFEMSHDSTERERIGLGVRQLYRAMSPWVLENPLMLHLTSTDPKVAYPAIDQAAECGFEMIIFSFGSGLDMEDDSEANIKRFREYREYANKKGLMLGGYSLLASRRINDENDVINPKTGKTGGAIFGDSPCLCSKWGEQYFKHIQHFIEATGFNLLEHDGSYPGDFCASTSHPGHRGLEDSQWKQYAKIAEFYRWCRQQGVFLNVPDSYFLAGSNKTGMGYRETNWSLPRDQQHIHARQNLFDGTWQKSPSMGWMFVPLVEYQGGGPAATIEPLHEHLADYEQHLFNNLSYGAQACYRGPRLYDSPETKAMVIKWVSWFKKYRAILESDVIHIRRADGRNLDGVLHVNPQLKDKGLAAFYNPTDKPIKQDIRFSVYYTGLSSNCLVSQEDKKPKLMKLTADHKLLLTVELPAHSFTWYVIRGAK